MLAKRVLVIVVLSLLVLIIPACGSNNDNNGPGITPEITQTSTATQTFTSTPTPSSNTSPVKIGAVQSWSGPAAVSGTSYADPVIKFIEKQVSDMGGILGGRQLKVVKYDNRASVAEATAGARKLVLEDKVCFLTFGGVSGVEFAATSDAAEELKVPYCALSGFAGIEQKKYTVTSSPSENALIHGAVDLINGLMQPKPKTVAFLQQQDATKDRVASEQSKLLEAAGVQTVSMQSIPPGTGDLMPFLTKVKYEKPDVFITDLDSEKAITVAKQVMELGGWGDIQVIGFSQSNSAAKFPGAEGWITVTTWTLGKDYPASQKFEQDWKTVIGGVPGGNHVYFYLNVLTAVEAIKFAGTDNPIKIAQELRSGNLSFDSPMGITHFQTNGDSGLKYMYAQIQKGGSIIEYKP